MRYTTRLLSSLALLSLCACASTQEPSPPPAQLASAEAAPKGKLPEDVTPTHYQINLNINPRLDRFSGEVIIDLELQRPRDVIWMHGASLNVTEATLTQGDVVTPATFEQVNDVGLARLALSKPAAAGKAQLRLVYDAPFDAELKGIYKVTVGDDAYAFTQFEATSARYAFPCFDEPRFKTPFDVSVLTSGGDLAVSNTLEQPTEAAGDKRRFRYATTAKLPTYLLAFAVGPLDIVDAAPIPPPRSARRRCAFAAWRCVVAATSSPTRCSTPPRSSPPKRPTSTAPIPLTSSTSSRSPTSPLGPWRTLAR